MTWAAREIGPTNTLLLTFFAEQQLRQWIRALSQLAPANSVLEEIDECEECSGKHPDPENPLTWLDDLGESLSARHAQPFYS